MIPLLITMDLEVAHDHDLEEQGNVLEKLCYDLKNLRLPLTVFSTGEAAQRYQVQLKMLNSNGNEIGCHGLNHTKAENYRIMPESMISYNISESTNKIRNATDCLPVSFRGPGMSTSAATQRILADNGYKADFSLCPQRLDFMYSAGGTIRWLFSPRKPYHPSLKNPYSRGNSKMWVVPLSCAGLPLISGMLYLFGPGITKMLFRLLLTEAKRTKQPLVYLFHSYELCRYNGFNNNNKNTVRQRRKFLHKFYTGDVKMRYEMNIKFFEFILGFKNIKPFTGRDFVKFLEENNK